MKLKTPFEIKTEPGRKVSCLLLFFLILTTYLSAQHVDFSSSNLPIVIINTEGAVIVDDPKIMAHMSIINNKNGLRNHITDLPNEYNGKIGIELRGSSSLTWPKKPYGIETRTESGENNNVSLLNMPAENDWILHAPYVDKTLMRNALIYSLAAEIGMYAPRTQFCELVLNNEYMGVFVLIEKIKKDKNRVNISEPTPENNSGGYLLEMVMQKQLEAEETHFKLPLSGKEVVVKYPKPDDILPEQFQYISRYLTDFELALNSETFTDPENGYAPYIDIPSFINQMLVSEGFNQLDAFCHSVFMHKNKDKGLKLGPGWDYNRSMGNAQFFNSWRTDVWWLKEPLESNPEGWYRINWPARFMKDPAFMNAYASRWYELRKSILSLDHLYELIDANASLLEEAGKRNFERWDVLGLSVNNKYAFDTYEEEVSYVKEWLDLKFSWLDEQFSQAENYALSASVNYSNQEEVNPATQAIDDATGTRWSAQFFPQWIELDLGEEKNINKTIIVPYLERAYQYRIEAKKELNDGYAKLIDRTDNQIGGTQIVDNFTSVRARYVRLTVTGAFEYTGDWSSISEFRVFGEEGLANNIDHSQENQVSLEPNYPNPFRTQTTIEYTLTKTGYVSLNVYDLLGKKVVQLVQEVKAPGTHRIIFRAEDLKAGFYIYKIDGPAYSKSRKMLLIK